ncbi:MFS transporter [Williamsia muralis]|nr:MFS transporter [Williamsia marianensis]
MPVGVALILLVLTIGSVRPVERPRLALVGGGAFAITAAAVVIAVASLAETSPVWMAPEIWGPVAVAGFAVFVAAESRQASPLIPFGVLRATGAWRPTVTMLFLGGAMTATFFFTTLNLQEFHGLTPLVTGVAFLPLSLGAFGAAASAHLLQRRLGVDMTTTIGASVMSVGLVAAWLVAGGSSPGMLIAATGVFGIGMGVALAAISDGTTLLLPSALTGIAAAVLTTAQQLGNSVGLAGTSVLDAAHPSIFYQTGFGSAAVLASLATAVIAGHTLARRRFPEPDKFTPIPSEDVPPLRRTGVPTMIDDHRGKRFT